MGEKRFVYILGIIKWINLSTTCILMSNIFIFMGMPSLVAVVLQLILIAVISMFVNKWFEKKFGSENLIENTRFFKIIIGLVISAVVAILIIKEEYAYLITILVYISLFSLVLFAVKKSKSISKGRAV